MKTIRFKQFGYYYTTPGGGNGNRSNISTVEVDDNFAAYVVGMGNAVDETPPG